MKNLFFLIIFIIAASSSASVVTAFKQMGPGINVNGGLTADPSSARAGDLYYNSSSNRYRAYNGATWSVLGIGDLTIGTFDSQSATANGATISSNQLFLQSEDATHPGLLNNTTQTISGAKTFSTAPILSSLTLSQAVVTDGSKNLASLPYASANTVSSLVERDGSGNFSAGTITATLSGSATSATNATNTAITDDTTTNATMYPTWVTTASGNQAQKVSSSKLTFNPSTANLTTTTFTGALTGTASGNTTYTPNNHGVVISGSGNAMTVIAPDSSTVKVLTSGGSSADPTWMTATGGGGTGINFVGLGTNFSISSTDDINGDATIGNWLAYADAAGTVPVDMTGGSPTTTCLRTSTAGHVLDGAGSIEVVKDAANRQGEGCSVVVNIPPGYRGQNTQLQIAFSIFSGSIASGDLILSAYDVTNSALLSLSGSSISGTGLLQANLVIPSTTAQMRIGFHFASTAATAVTFDFDDVVLGPPNNIGQGPIITNFVSDSPSTQGCGSISGSTFMWRRVGDSIEEFGKFTCTTAGPSEMRVNLPSGLTIDGTKVTATVKAGEFARDANVTYTAGSTLAQASVGYINFGEANAGGTAIATGQLSPQNGNAIFSNGNVVSFYFKAPILQWSTNGATFRPDTVANSWSGYHDNTCSWTVTNTAYTDFALDASCALVERVNRNFGTVSTSGSVKPAITFTPTHLGAYQVCVAGTVADATIAKLVALRLWDGTTVIAERDFVQAVATDGTNFSFCGLYKATSLSAVTLSLQGQSDAGALTLAAVRATTALEWSIIQIDQQIPAPLLVNSVVSPSIGIEQVMRANLTCSSSSAINSQSGTWITSIGNVSSGKCIVTLSGSPFSGTGYDCAITENGTLVNGIRGWNINNKSTSAFDLYGASITTGSSTIAAITNETFDIICMGPH